MQYKKIKNPKESRRLRIKRGIRKTVEGSIGRPRLSVYRSNSAIYVQLIDDSQGSTLLSCSTRVKDISDSTGTKQEKSKLVGKMLAEKAIAAGYEHVVFDRNGFKYHGRVKSVAEGAREGGLKF